MMLFDGIHISTFYCHFRFLYQSVCWFTRDSLYQVVCIETCRKKEQIGFDFESTQCNNLFINWIHFQNLMTDNQISYANRQVIIILGIFAIILLLLAIAFKLAIQ